MKQGSNLAVRDNRRSRKERSNIFQGEIHWVLDSSDRAEDNVRDPVALLEFIDKGVAHIIRAWPKEEARAGHDSPVPRTFMPGDILAVKMRDFVLLGLNTNTYSIVYAFNGLVQRTFWIEVATFVYPLKNAIQGMSEAFIEKQIITPFLEFVKGVVIH